MRKLQPELERIKKQTKGNKQLEGAQMMELYKKHGVNPFRSIGILLIQLPIFIALYHVIQVLTLYRHEVSKYAYDFLEQIPAVAQLIAHPENFNQSCLVFSTCRSMQSDSMASISSWFCSRSSRRLRSSLCLNRQCRTRAAKKSLREILADASSGKRGCQSEINNAIMGKMIYVLPFFMLLVC